MTPAPVPSRISVVIPIWRSERWITGCLDALTEQVGGTPPIVVVDNASGDGASRIAREHRSRPLVLAQSGNLGFAAAANVGIAAIETPSVALLNPDTVAEPDWLTAALGALDDAGPRCGSIASLMLSMEDPGRVDDAGDELSWYGAATKRGHGEPAERWLEPGPVFSASAGAAVYRREMLEDVGGFDERFFAYLEDVDVGLRGQLLGWECRYAPTARVHHAGGGSGARRADYVRWTARNRLLVFWRSIPASLLRRHAGHLMRGTLFFALAHRRPIESLRGWRQARRWWPEVRAEQSRFERRRKLSDADVEALLHSRPPWMHGR